MTLWLILINDIKAQISAEWSFWKYYYFHRFKKFLKKHRLTYYIPNALHSFLLFHSRNTDVVMKVDNHSIKMTTKCNKGRVGIWKGPASMTTSMSLYPLTDHLQTVLNQKNEPQYGLATEVSILLHSDITLMDTASYNVYQSSRNRVPINMLFLHSALTRVGLLHI